MFTKSSNGTVTLELIEIARDYLQNFLEQAIELIDAPSDVVDSDPLKVMFGPVGPTTMSRDPALARLFPQAYTDDDEASGEFRKFAEPDLRIRKVSDAKRAIDTLAPGPVSLTHEDALAWLGALNDLRLVLGTRLDIGSDLYDNLGEEFDDDEEFSGDDAIDVDADEFDDPEDVLREFYGYLTYLQGTLVESLS